MAKQTMFRDFNLNFQMNPISGDIAVLTNEKSIAQSLKNLLLTNYGDVPFKSFVGSGLDMLLFEPVSETLNVVLNDKIREVIKNYEPRIEVIGVVIKDDSDANSYDISIHYKIVNTNQSYTANISLSRLQ